MSEVSLLGRCELPGNRLVFRRADGKQVVPSHCKGSKRRPFAAVRKNRNTTFQIEGDRLQVVAQPATPIFPERLLQRPDSAREAVPMRRGEATAHRTLARRKHVGGDARKVTRRILDIDSDRPLAECADRIIAGVGDAELDVRLARERGLPLQPAHYIELAGRGPLGQNKSQQVPSARSAPKTCTGGLLVLVHLPLGKRAPTLLKGSFFVDFRDRDEGHALLLSKLALANQVKRC